MSAEQIDAWEPRTLADALASQGGVSTYDDMGSSYKLTVSSRVNRGNQSGARNTSSGSTRATVSNKRSICCSKSLSTLNSRANSVRERRFQPRARNWSEDDGTPWAGEILVDTKDHQPVFISTRLARGLPVVVKTLLGTNLKGLGFKLTYERFDEGLWFPVNYGAEFEVRAVFFYRRKVAIALNNNGFKRAQVETKVSFDEPLQIERVMKAPEVKIAPPPHPLP